MSFFEDASLVLIPSAQKTSKVYSVKPTDGTGDLTFTRSNDTATRVNSAGLIEKVRTNLVLQSVWPSIGTGVAPTSWVVGTGPATSFSAGPLAGQLLCNTSASRGFITQSVSLTAGEYALSVFVDSVTTTNAVADLVLIFGSTNRKYYEDGVQVDLNTNVVAGKRYAMVGTVTTGSFSMRIGSGVNANATANYVISRPQLEVSDFGATPYIATTTAAVSVGPVANVPRLDYLNSSCPRLILEGQRTNFYPLSEQLNQWTATAGSTVTANYAVSPDGYQNADRVQFSSATEMVYNSGTGSAGENTLSVYAKATNGTSAKFRFFANGATTYSSDQTATGEWQRFTFTYTYSAQTAGLRGATTGASDVIFYGFQHEIGAYATSYIPTLGAAVTRGADAASKTGISSLIGQTEGTIFVDFQLNQAPSDANGRLLQLWATNDTTNAIIPIVNQSLQLQITTFGATAGTAIISAGPSTLLGLGQNKIAVAYTSTSVVVYRNGVLFASGNPTGFFPTSLTSLDLGGSSFAARNLGNPINQALLFKTRLPNSSLAELTSL